MNETQTQGGDSRKAWVGIDIGGTKTAVVISQEPPAILARSEFATLPEQGPSRAIDLIQRSIYELLRAQNLGKHEIKAIGISCGGPLDRVSGTVQAPPNLSTWVDVPITSILQREFDVPCRLENDANAGAVAEHRFGAGKGAQNVVFLTMGTGLGAGIIIDGRLYRGSSDSAGEVGHVRLTSSGPIGYNKAGSVEGWASGGGIGKVAVKRVSAALSSGKPTSLAAVLQQNGTITAKDVAVAAQQADKLAMRIILDTGKRLGQTLAILVDLLNPERIVIGGLALRLGESVLNPARKVMRKEALAPSAKICRVVPATLGEQIGDVAAICVAMGL